MADVTDVVVVGGGIVGLSVAYYLSRAGVRSTVIERDSIGSHASGFAFGELTPSRGAGIPGPFAPLAQLGLRMHRELSPELREQTGIDPGYHVRPTLALMLTEEDVDEEKARFAWEQHHASYRVRWIDGDEARRLEPRLTPGILGAVCLEGTGEVDPYRLVLALAGAAEKGGATIRTGLVTGLRVEGGRVTAIRLESGELACKHVVLATGPWAPEGGPWVGARFPVMPIKGEILRLRVEGAPVEYRVLRGHHYAATKPDGLTWAGTTLDDAGFDDAPTEDARRRITEGVLAILPSLIDAQLVEHTACLRPVTPDSLPILGPLPGREGVYVATGAGRKGILAGPPMGKAIADLIITGATTVPLQGFEPDRFSGKGL